MNIQRDVSKLARGFSWGYMFCLKNALSYSNDSLFQKIRKIRNVFQEYCELAFRTTSFVKCLHCKHNVFIFLQFAAILMFYSRFPSNTKHC